MVGKQIMVCLIVLLCVQPSVVLADPVSNDYSWVRGTHYFVYGGSDYQIRRELNYGRRIGLNANRIFLNKKKWERDSATYIERISKLVKIGYECGYKTMLILFNGNNLDPSLLEDSSWDENRKFVRAVVDGFKNAPGLLMWDLMNEPGCNGFIGARNVAVEEQRRRQNLLTAFVKRVGIYVRELDPVTARTVGCYRVDEMEQFDEAVDVLSFHDYSGTRQKIEENFKAAEACGKKLGKCVLQTETGCLARANGYDMALYACQEHHMGYFLFNHMIQGYCDSEHGIFYSDGTVRDPATIAAIMGCYRNRDLSTIVPPLANRENEAVKCIQEIEGALVEKNRNQLAYVPADVTAMLDAGEHAANLLECCQLVSMSIPPTARIEAWRAMKNPPRAEIRRFIYDLRKQLSELCEIP